MKEANKKNGIFFLWNTEEIHLLDILCKSLKFVLA